ncbi:MAG: pilus assembly protein PilM [Pyrinomonadaceae bacterium]
MLALEVKKTLDFYRTTAPEDSPPVEKILITGGGSKLRDLEAYLSERLELPVERFDPFRQIKVDNRRFDPDYMREVMPEMAVAVGLALRGVDA